MVSMLPPWVSSTLLTLPVFPYLWLPHCALMCLALRATLAPGLGPLHFARRHPLSCYLLGITYTFSGKLVGLLLNNQSVLTVLTLSTPLYSYTVVWYLVFFSPSDLLYRLLTLLPLAPLLAAAQDWMRLAAVRTVVAAALVLHPQAFLYPVVLATLTSSGFMVVKYIEQVMLRGDLTFTIGHHATKTMAVSAALMTARAQGWLAWVEAEDLYCCLVLMAMALRLVTSYVMKSWDPYSSLETQACRLLYGNPQLQQEEPVQEQKKKESKKQN